MPTEETWSRRNTSTNGDRPLSACSAYCGKNNYGTIKRQWNFHYIITKKGKDRASSDVGFMFVAYNLRRIFNLVDQEALKKYLKMLWLCFLAILDYLRARKKLIQRSEIYRFHNYQFLQPHPNSRKWAYIQTIQKDNGGFWTNCRQRQAVLTRTSNKNESISIAMWGKLIHDLPMSFLSAVGVIDSRQHEIAMNSPTIFRSILWICYLIYFIAFFILFPLSVRVVHRLNWIKSIAIGSLAFIIFQTIFLIFNR